MPVPVPDYHWQWSRLLLLAVPLPCFAKGHNWTELQVQGLPLARATVSGTGRSGDSITVPVTTARLVTHICKFKRRTA